MFVELADELSDIDRAAEEEADLGHQIHVVGREPGLHARRRDQHTDDAAGGEQGKETEMADVVLGAEPSRVVPARPASLSSADRGTPV